MKCCVCGKKIEGYGHNPWPLVKADGVKCCDECNLKVLAARIEEAKKQGETK